VTVVGKPPCPVCHGRGAEPATDSEGVDRMRPCVHCDAGKALLETWTKPKGPYDGMTAQRIASIMTRPCAHDPIGGERERDYRPPAPAD
jgi:hypothetical protein